MHSEIVGYRNNEMSMTAIWAAGLRKESFNTRHPVTYFVRDDATGCLVSASSLADRHVVV